MILSNKHFFSILSKYYWLLILLAVGLLSFVFYKSNTNKIDQLGKVNNGLATLISLDKSIENILIGSLYDLKLNYDELVDANNQYIDFKDTFFKSMSKNSKQIINTQWRKFGEISGAKQLTVETIKSKVGVYKNSLAYFPLLLLDIKKKTQSYLQYPLINSLKQLDSNLTTFTTLLNELENEFFLFIVNEGPYNYNKLDLKFQQIAGISRTLPLAIQENLKYLFIHTQIIINGKIHLKQLVTKIFNNDLENQINVIQNTYLKAYNEEKKASDFYRVILFFLAAILTGIIFVFSRYMIKSASRLRQTNKDLNFQKFALDQHDIVSITDVKGNITYANDRFCKLSGYSLEELIGANHRIVKSDYHDPSIYQQMWRTIASGKVWHGIIKNKTKQGNAYWVDATIVPFVNDKGKPFQYVAIRTDITKRMQIQEELIEAKKQSDLLSQLKSDFVANMSHELRTPLNAIIGLNHLVLQSQLNEEQRSFLEKVELSSNNLLGLINDILDMSKIEAGKLQIEQVSFDLDEKLRLLYEVMIDKAQEHNLGLYFSIDPDIPHTIISDSLRINQILTNLISNAIKFTPQGEITLSVEVLNKDNSNRNIELGFYVKDTGIGLTKDQQSKLFSAFNQADTSTSRKYGGTGLGLSISKNLTELFGGSIIVESEIGKGCTFSFNILCRYEEEVIVKNSDNLLNNTSILLIDNQEITQRILNKMLTSFNLTKITYISDNFDEDKLNYFIQGSSSEQGIQPSRAMRQLILINAKLLIDNVPLVKQFKDFFNNLGEKSLPIGLILFCFGHQKKELPVLHSRQNNVFQPITPSIMFNSMLELVDDTSGDKKSSDRVNNKHKNSKNKLTNTHAKIQYNAHILLAEDNKINQLVASKLLKQFGIRVTIANNGKEALACIGTNSIDKDTFDMIFMDIQMPEMDGIEASQIIRSQTIYDDLPIIAVTAHALDDEKQRCFDVGMNDHLGKPIIPLDLENVLAKYLKPRKLS